jgi:hypothetical protein
VTITNTNLGDLLRAAELKDRLRDKCKASMAFESNWEVVSDWTEQSRYESKIDSKKARSLIKAISSSRNGVLQWMKSYW